MTYLDEADYEEYTGKNWTPLIILVVLIILGLNYSVSFHDQRQEANRYLICITKNNTIRWEGKCFPIMWR